MEDYQTKSHLRTPESSQSSSNPSSSTSTSTTVLIPAKRYHRYPTRSTSDGATIQATTTTSTSSSQPSPSISISAPTTLDTSTYLPQQLRRKAAIPLPFNAADFDNPSSQYDSVYAEPGRRMVTDDVVDLRDTNSAMTVTTMSRARSRSYDDRLDGRGRRARTGNMMGSERMNSDGDAGMSAEHFELVPYSNEWTVILRNDSKGELVLYNAESRAVSVQRMPRRTHMHQMSNPDICLLCRRPFDTSNNAESSQPTFMDVNYFRLLAHVSHSPVPSRSTSPTSSSLPSRSTSPTGSTRPSTPTSSAPTSATPASPTASGGFRAHLNVKALNQGYYERFFVEGRKLGRGFRGSVFLCQHILDQVYLGEYAIKKVAVGDNHVWLVRMLREVHLLEKLHHPNIVDYKHAWLEEHKLTQFGPQVPCLFILMECANGGNLEEYIETPPITIPTAISTPTASSVPPKFRAKDRARLLRRQDVPSPAASFRVDRRRLTLGEVWSLFLDTCEGLAHLHRHNIVHRDLKPPNLLLNWEDGIRLGRTPRVLISDFGECEVLDELTDRDRTGATGTLEFMAPELVKVDERGKYLRDFSPKSDMWSLGMVLYYLCYSALPYRQVEDVDELKEEILAFHGVIFPSPGPTERTDIPQILKELMRALLSPNPAKRPSCDEILSKVRHMRPAPAGGRFAEGEGEGEQAVPATGPGAGVGVIVEEVVSGARDMEGRREKEEAGTIVTRERSGPMIERIPSEVAIAARIAGEVGADINADAPMEIDGMEEGEKVEMMIGKRRAVDAAVPTSTLRKRRKSEERVTRGEEKEGTDGEGAGLDYMAVDEQERRNDEHERDGDARHSHTTSPNSTTSTTSTPPILIAPHNMRLLGPSHGTGIERLLPSRALAVYEALARSEEGWWPILKIAVVVVKVATCITPCQPYVPSAWVLYPVLVFAVLDFWTSRRTVSLLLAFVHIGWVACFLAAGALCVQ